MSAALEDIKLEDIPVDDIDFSDLEKQYSVNDTVSFDQYIVVCGAPVIPEGKVAVLKKALTGLFSKAGKVVDIEFPIEDGKTKGFLFVECASPADGNKIIKAFHTKRLDLKHRLFIYTMRDVEKYNDKNFPTEFVEPEIPDFFPTSTLKSWLSDEDGRDQFVLQANEMTTVLWNSAIEDEESVVESRKNWSTNYIRFSPKGTYLFSYHPQGVVMWGGPHFDRLRRFYHPNVRTSSVSPSEKFLVTYSPDPIVVDEEDADCPFTKKNEGHQLCIWDIDSGLLQSTFPVVKSSYLQWPLVRWSYNDQYCARMVGETLVVHDVKKGFAVMDNKTLKVPGIRDFSFAPTGVKIAPFRANDKESVILAYWTPETNNMSCKATIVDVERSRVLKTVNLVQVSNVTLHWQSDSEFLCFNVERHTKSKKTQFSNLEICKLTEKDIPGDKIELKDCVVDFAWEPHGNRFGVIAVRETGDDNIAIPKNVATFFAPEKRDVKDKSTGVKKWLEVASITDKFSNTISWSPAGRYVVVATLVKPNVRRSDFVFYDMDFATDKNMNVTKDVHASLKEVATNSFPSATDMAWDPSGRFLAVWSSSLKHKMENGYKVFNVAGTIVKEEPLNSFKNFAWRPRPASLLTNAEKKKIRKNLKEWTAQFAEQDAMEADAATRDMILRQREMLKDWTEYRAEIGARFEEEFGYKTFNMIPLSNSEDDFTSVEEVKEEVLEESEEKVVE
ncbi:hypothetical protein Kpol_538p39 [Vanderwaltozyma polyspora DSM 70294]|uniref:Eukaryotic translation initiation factor 3 subunit B n=1 Tax=Vanderwaltozyma polyspora (strain ATCC 22028 / DSM 70294 / BCRC 21397 / CBS 2163 / NBRC 10782 / NRRL Y-8283 / UCD 57-17) TaxID=436907 RepID=EIF3B_VANPO|nr:uncharacterized protein Kpol_538p39 [Vanderwaltozyma polyspora DSM 70294]A7TKF2.1 RecName: Full=Eukaryotic translation initiation factor 3 subunit B; Short=eIF3b; AltName: Full=Eukaryotic translation initiation factor 3 90 kDa subunit homolog; Short=eIF3 p90; AltName: Full=Translation initiation factor eIF3 p90 subunit homolog [Vanderwaltozyma polyspora DSM 70294]EDO17279.1 hypothetical protein Kpol_538p39 [Vanderwaltozyma polyspora DSM 70294]